MTMVLDALPNFQHITMYSVQYHSYLLNTFVVCPYNQLYSWGYFQPLKFLRRILFHIEDLVGNHLNYLYLHSF